MSTVVAEQRELVTGTPVGPRTSSSARPKLAQLNVRIDVEAKQQAEDVLRLMGSSPTELVRAVYAKVAQGAQAYEELMTFLEGREAQNEAERADSCEEERKVSPLLEEAWAIGRNYFLSVGIDPDTLPKDDRSWDEVYHEAMDAHFREKGLML